MTSGVWFTLSLGRKNRADPKWLLPMICKAGGVTKADVGSIKIDDLETRFEIAADKAEAFAGKVAGARNLEKGVRIAPAGGGAPRPVPPKDKGKQKPNPKDKGKPKPKAKHRGEDEAPRPAAPPAKKKAKKPKWKPALQ